MRLLIASTEMPPISGGAEQVVWETATRLAPSYEIHILTVGAEKTILKENVRIHYISLVRPWSTISTALYSTILKHKLETVFSEISPSILHSHSALPWANVFAKAKCAKIVTCHGGFNPSYESPGWGYRVRVLLKRAYENADIVTAPSKWLSYYIQDKFKVTCLTIPNGVDTERFAPISSEKIRDNVILFIGQLTAVKGLKEIFEAARALENYEFWFAGDPKTRRVDFPDLPNIKVLGFVPEREKPVLYNQATLCVFPSYWENSPVVGLEAMSCGKAIVATRWGFDEYIENGKDGVIIDPRRPDQLIESIRGLMEDKDLRTRIGQNARDKALRYDWKTIIKMYQKMYDGLN